MRILRLLSLVFVIGVVVLIFIFRDEVRHLARYGYPGLFLVTMISNATVFIPVPGVMVVFALGAVLNPLITALVAGLGAATGELFGYLLGFSGTGIAERSTRYQQVYTWMSEHQKFSDLAVLVLAAIPNPFFDLAGIAAGTLKIPVLRFWFFCAIGSILKMLFFAYAGSTSLRLIFGP